VIDLLRNALAAVLRFFAPRAIVAAENHLLRHQLVVPPLLVAASPAPQTRPMADDDVGDPSALAPRGGDRGTTRDGSPVASSGLAAVVALPLEPSGRPGADRRRVAGPHPADVAGEPPVGREPDCRRTREAWAGASRRARSRSTAQNTGAWPRSVLENFFPEPRLPGLVLRLCATKARRGGVDIHDGQSCGDGQGVAGLQLRREGREAAGQKRRS
jgi:hypothetical protein